MDPLTSERDYPVAYFCALAYLRARNNGGDNGVDLDSVAMAATFGR